MKTTAALLFALAASLAAVLAPAGTAGPPGSLDPSFSGDGEATFPIGADSDLTFDAVKQPDGKIVLVGSSFDGTSYQVAVIRVDGTGNLDPSFGGDGIVQLDFGNGDDSGFSLALQSDGKIVLTGQAWTGSESDVFVIRLNSDGTPDTTFDGDGRVVTDLNGEDQGTGVAVDGNGNIVVVGETFITPDDSAFFLARYKPNGAPDTSLDGTGVRVTNLGPGLDGARGLAVLPDGRIVSVGTAGVNSAFVVYNAGGTVAQQSELDFGGDDALNNVVAIDPLHWAAVGSRSNGSNSDLFVARFVLPGALDSGFGTGGYSTADGFGFDDFGNDLLVDPATGAVYGLGSARTGTGAATSDFFITRFSANGSLDPSFGAGGKAFDDFFGGQDSALAGVLVGDKAYAAGPVTNAQGKSDFGIARFVTANHAPSAAHSSFTNPVPAGTAAAFDASPSSDPDGDPLLYDWSFDDLAAPLGGVKVAHAFSTAGVHKVSLLVTDTAGATDKATFDVNVTPAERTFTLRLPGRPLLGRPFSIAGEVTSSYAACVSGVRVELLFDPAGGTGRFGVVRRGKTDQEGALRLSSTARRGRYQVRAPATPACAEATSGPARLKPVIAPLVFTDRFAAPGRAKRHAVLVQGTALDIHVNSGVVDITGITFFPARSISAAGKPTGPIRIAKTRGRHFVRVHVTKLKPGGKLRFKVVAKKISRPTLVETRVTQRF